MRSVVWVCGALGVFIAFAWPFAVSPDPANEMLKLIARTVTTVLLLALVAAAVVRARHKSGGG